jgi:NADPH:quinone reductase
MRAVVIRRFGAPEVLAMESVPDPPAARGEVVIDVQYAGVTFVETQIRAGRPPDPAMAPQLPVILGNGVAGTVGEVGDDADRGLLGRAVVSTTGGRGGYAERVAVDAGLPIAIPDGLGPREAVALLADGRTALSLAEAAKIRPGETVVVEAAAGGVGSCLVQLARAAGARVLAGVGSEAKRPTATALGAAHVVDYSQPGWDARVLAEVGAVDVVFDGIGGDIGAAALRLLRSGGRFCQYGMAGGAFTDTATAGAGIAIVRGTALTPLRSRELSVEALQRARAGELVATIGQEHPLERAAAAHAAIEARSTIGKTLLTVGTGAEARPG